MASSLELPKEVYKKEGRWYKSCPTCNQEMKCALTGWDIDAMTVSNNTASLDRINSLEGYVVGNVQWVHKMVNM